MFGLGMVLGSCLEITTRKVNFLQMTRGENICQSVRQGEKQTKFNGRRLTGTGLSRPLHHGGPRGRKAPSRAPRSAETGAGLPPPLRGLGWPCPEGLILVIKNMHASWERFSSARGSRHQLLFTEGCWRWVAGLGHRRPRGPGGGAGSRHQARRAGGELPYRPPSLGLPACSSLSSSPLPRRRGLSRLCPARKGQGEPLSPR